MQQIDQIGWDKMCWGRGFTLLHWAAKHALQLMSDIVSPQCGSLRIYIPSICVH